MSVSTQDLREWVRSVEALGQLTRLKGVPWDLVNIPTAASRRSHRLAFESAPLDDVQPAHAVDQVDQAPVVLEHVVR